MVCTDEIENDDDEQDDETEGEVVILLEGMILGKIEKKKFDFDCFRNGALV